VSPGVVRCGVFLGDSVTRARPSVQRARSGGVGGGRRGGRWQRGAKWF